VLERLSESLELLRKRDTLTPPRRLALRTGNVVLVLEFSLNDAVFFRRGRDGGERLDCRRGRGLLLPRISSSEGQRSIVRGRDRAPQRRPPVVDAARIERFLPCRCVAFRREDCSWRFLRLFRAFGGRLEVAEAVESD